MEEVQQIRRNHEERQAIRHAINAQLQQIVEKAAQIDGIVGERDERQVRLVEQAVQEIRHIFDQNEALKADNRAIQERIKHKKSKLASMAPRH